MVVSQWRRWLNRISESSRRGGVGKRPRPAARSLLYLEVLEDRTAPAVFTVVNTLDDGSAGSLRWAINRVNADADPVSNINFNIPGSGAQTIALNTELPTITHPVVIDGFTQPGSSPNTLTTSDNAVRLITLDGSNLPYIPDASQADGLTVAAGGSTIRGLVLTNFGFGVHLMTNGTNAITGNEINHCVNFGVEVEGSSNNTIGGITPDARNLITADFAGILIGTDQSGTIASANVVQGNYVGPDATGAAAASVNMEIGIWLVDNAVNNTIGGTTAAARNVISGATLADVEMEDGSVDGAGPLGNVVEGNFIGTNAAGDAALVGASAPYGAGVTLGLGVLTGNVIGGTTAGAGNTIAFNNGPGVDDGGGTGNPIEGNTIAFNQGPGISVGGTGDRIGVNSIYGNGGLGIVLGGYAPALVPNEPGGPFTGPNNSSITNLTATLSGSEVVVTGTLNGIADTPYFARFNINGDVSTSTIITTDASGTAFVADFAASEFPDFTGAVTFLAGGATPPHFGGNYLQNYPVLTAAQSGSSVLVSGTLNGQANTTFAVDVYANPTADPSGYGQGQYYLGATTVTTDASGNASFAADFSAANLPGGVLPDGWAVSATATDPGGNTSEFSKDVFASSANALQGALTSGGTVNIQATTQSQAQAVLAAANSLVAATTPTSTIVLDLGGQTVQDTIANLPPQVTLTIVNGTFIGGSPALVVTSGQVIISNSTFSNATDAPTILVTGGSLTLRNDVVQESTGYRDAAISVTGGTVDLGTATDPGGNTLNINGHGLFISNTGANPVSALGDTFEHNGAAVTDPYRIENHIFDALDAGGGGLVTFVAGNVYVTARTGGIQRAVDAVAVGGTVNVAPGAYTGYNAGAKPLTIQFQNGPSITQAADPDQPGAVSLTVHGWATGDDRIEFSAGDAGAVHVDVNGVPRGTFAPTGRLIAYGGAGLTDISVDGAISLSAWLFAGTGNTRLTGGGGNNVLVGGAGADELIGGSGRDLMIGGSGASTLRGNGGDDILISGYTVYDANDAALWAIMAEWTSADSFTQRVADLSDTTSSAGFANRRNGNYFLIADVTVFNDPSKDKLNGGGGGDDWLFADAADNIQGLTRSDDLTLFS